MTCVFIDEVVLCIFDFWSYFYLWSLKKTVLLQINIIIVTPKKLIYENACIYTVQFTIFKQYVGALEMELM